MTEVSVEEASLNTARDFALEKIREWHKAEANKHVAKPLHADTPEEALRWFCAYREATILHEANMIKDWAYMLLDGIGPMTVEAELQIFQGYIEADDRLVDDWKKWLLKELREHFGIIEEENTP